jgi:hypothetical protein
MHTLNENLSSETGLPTLLPSGWLQDQLSGSVLKAESEEAYQDLFGRLDHIGKARHVWHTWLTGIYRTESIPADVWFKGGTPGTDVSQLEVRPRDRGS